MDTIAIDECSVVWASVSLFVIRATVLTYSPDGVTSMWPLIHYSNHLFVNFIRTIFLRFCDYKHFYVLLTADALAKL